MTESPGQARSRAFASIPAPRAGISASSFSARAIQPAAHLGRRALQGGELDAPDAEQREASRLVERSGRGPATARPVDHRPLLDPWGLARACFGLSPPLPRSFRREAGQPGYPASDRHPQGRDWTPGPTIAAPRGLARDETDGAGKAAKEGKGARLGAQAGAAGRSLERGPGQRTGCGQGNLLMLPTPLPDPVGATRRYEIMVIKPIFRSLG